MSLKERSSSLRNIGSIDQAFEALRISSDTDKTSTRTRVASESGVSGFFGRIRDVISGQSKKNKATEFCADANLSKRATSTPMRPETAKAEEILGIDLDYSSILAEPAVVPVNFAELGAFGSSGMMLNKDFDNDITAFSFHKQVVMPPIRDSWQVLGGNLIYTKTVLFAFELCYDGGLPREVLHLAVYYACSVVKGGDIVRDDLQDLIVAAVRLASKVENQSGLSRRILRGFDMRRVISFEKKIMLALDFDLWPATLPFFTRLLFNNVCKSPWHWPFAKCASDLVMCDAELAEVKSSLIAGVLMRFLSILEGGNTWTDNCYAIIQEPAEDYARPHAVLCRLFVAVFERPKAYFPIASKYSAVLNKVLPGRIDFLRAEVASAGL